MDNELLQPTNLKGTTTAPVEQRLEAFMQELDGNTVENWLNERERIWQGLVGLEIESRWGKIHISAIRTFPASLTMNGVSTRGQGYASKALDWLCALADKYQVTLDGYAKPYGGNDPDDKKTRFNKAQLMSWYKRHGFTVDSKGNMVRPAKGAEPELEKKPFVLKLRKDAPMVEVPLKQASTGTRTYYHVTPTRNVPKILQEGLVPRLGTRSKSLGETQKGIYLFPSLDDLDNASWLEDAFGEQRLTVLQVQVPEDARLLPTSADYEVIVADPIPPQNIKKTDVEV